MDNTHINKQLARIVRFHRKKVGLTQLQLAHLAGVGKTAVFDVEQGKSTMQLNTIVSILSALNVQIHFTSPLMHLCEVSDAKS